MSGETGVPEGIRTPDLRFRKPLLYPAELPGRTRAHYSRKGQRRSSAISLASALLAGLGLSGPALACDGRFARAGEPVTVNARLEIALSDELLLRPEGLAPFPANPQGADRMRTASIELANYLSGKILFVHEGAGAADRWGRITAPLRTGAGQDLANWLVGLGLVRADPVKMACAPDLYAAEARARQAKLGLWADPVYAILAANDPDALKARAGEFVIVEGRVLRIGQTSTRFYLDFGPAKGMDLSVTFDRRAAKAFSAAGLSPDQLAGRALRVRGHLHMRPGPQIEIGGPAALEATGR